ncbi:hypothetical protein ELZ19_07040 [Brucella abortus]|uniref:hypothetical protein n=1 Tax=Brucella abortus TaxID=235 RepID=UPI0004E8DB12|nr:hypothetical protein [Brucella abortus]KFH18441.1 hypothetical protein IB60_17195 [Brucella abortus LMN1]RUQ67326.1 hypothetical protein ELZ23_15470 [Brucella abortus]RUQ78542.1 hypothetical protein ELZ22_17120 [Brucella abortus]RUQ88285.1 hypothetical protein ELZ18_15610 [Brucella abortus]RUQ90314.1 hypothetical protein ELZ20_15605 [Brucella abortus]
MVLDKGRARNEALVAELQTQRGLLGDRAAQLASEVATLRVEVAERDARIASLEKELARRDNEGETE